MDAKRLSFVIEQCLQGRRREDVVLFHTEIAGFLRVAPITLRRWLRGERAVPRMVEIIFEIFHNWPEVSAGDVDKVIARRDRGLEVGKQH